jgi:hypothetical protein
MPPLGPAEWWTIGLILAMLVLPRLLLRSEGFPSTKVSQLERDLFGLYVGVLGGVELSKWVSVSEPVLLTGMCIMALWSLSTAVRRRRP